MAYAMGFNPVELEKAYEASGEMWKEKGKMSAQVSRYGQAVSEAYLQNDQKAIKDLFEQAIVQGIPLDSIERSASMRLRNAQEEVHTRNFSDEMIEERLNLFPAQ